MVCYTHNDHPAIATCTHCGRGMCAACTVEVGDGRLACKDRCEPAVRESARLAQRANSAYSRNGWFYLLTGAAFLAYGLWQVSWNGLQGVFLSLLGVFLLLASLLNFIEGRARS